MKKLIVALWTVLSMGAALHAQTLGEITGIVADSSGAVVAGANITATNNGTNQVRSTTSNASGVYSFPAINPGVYTVKVEARGFKTGISNNVEVQVQANVRIDFDLVVGQVSESVEVSASAASLNTENSTVGTVIENKRIVDLPLNGRNALSLVALSPNVSFGFQSAGQADNRQGGIRANQNIAVGGQRSQFNHFTLDGVENTDPNFNTFVVVPSVDAMQEFKVQTGIYPAEFGRGTTQINLATKSGANDYHGTLYEFLRNEKMDAKNYAFTSQRPPKDPFKWNQFGFTISGPISVPKLFNGKNKLFFMTNYEWFRQRRAVQGLFSVPSAQMREGNFSELPLSTQGIWDPATRPNPGASGGSMFPGNVIPRSRFDATSQQLLEFYPAPNVPGGGVRNNYLAPLARPVNRDQFIGRFDFVESANSQWFGRYSWGDENQLNAALRLNGEQVVTNFNQYMASNTRVLTPAIVNEFRFGFTQFYNTTGPELAFTRDVVGELKIPGLNSGPPVQWGIPSVTFDGYSGLGNGSEGPYENNNRSLQFIDNLSWSKGKHTYKFGVEIRNDVYRQLGNQFARGNFGHLRNATRNPGIAGITGDAFADFLLGQIQQAEAAVQIATADFRANSFYLYFDDSWKISSKLILNYGLRYENTPPWTDQTGTLFNAIVPNEFHPTDFRNAQPPRDTFPYFLRQGASRQNCFEGIAIRPWPAPGPQNPAPVRAFGRPEVRCDGSLGNRLVGRDNNDFAPRVGLAFSPNAKWVIRAGGGIFYSQDSGNPRFDMARNLAGRGRDNADTKYLTWANAVPQTGELFERPYTFANPYDRRTPKLYQFMLNVQRELWGNTLFEVGYLGSVGHRLEALRSQNEALPAPRTSGLSGSQRSPFPNFGIIQQVDNNGNGNYNSLGAKLTKRFSNGLTYLLSYTYAKSIDTASAIRNQGGDTLFPQNSYCRDCERARSSHDVRQRYVTSALWDIPIGKGRRLDVRNGFLNTLVGGWQVGSILTLQSGFPLTVTQSGDSANVGHTFGRPNSTGVDAYAGFDRTPSRWFNTAAFTRAPDGFFGNVGRNTMTSPGIVGWDFSMLKDFNFTERHRLQFRFEAFNFPNHPILNGPNTNIADANFGVINGTRTNMRNLQIALKYIF